MGECIDWRVMEAAALVGGVFWLVSALLVSLLTQLWFMRISRK
jgi:hypothetical protein